MGTRKLLVVLALLSLFLPAPSAATDARAGSQAVVDIGLTAAEKEFLKGKTLRLGVDGSSAPLEYFDNKGAYAGICAEYMQEVARRLGVGLEPLRVPRAVALTKARTGEVDVLVQAEPSPALEEYLRFTRRYMTFTDVIVTRRETPVSNLAQFRGRQVGVVEGEATQELERSYPDLRYVRYGSIAQALKDLSAGRIEAVVDSLGMVIYHMDRLGLTNLRISGCTPFVHDICLGVRKDRPLLASALDKAVASITEREKATIKQRWLVQDHRGDGWVSWRLAGICGAAMAAAIAAVVGWGWHLKRGIAERLRTERVLAEYARQLERQASLKATAASIGAELQQAAGPREMARRLLDRMAPLLGADCALFYASERDGTLLRQACGYGVREDVSDTGSVPVGQGLVGQCALEKKRIVVAPPAAGTMRITWGSGSARPAVLLLQPVLQGGRLLGVMEFGALGAFAPDHEGILDELLPIIGMNLEIQYNNECRHSSEHCRGLLATLPQC